MTNQRILVVDDEPQVQVLKLYLTRDGFRVHTAADGEAALSAFETHASDLVALDKTLPAFKRLHTQRAPLIVLLTAEIKKPVFLQKTGFFRVTQKIKSPKLRV